VPRCEGPLSAPKDQYGLGDERFGGQLPIRRETVNTFSVWTRPLGSACRVRVDGVKNTQWLLKRLARSFVFKASEPLQEDEGSSCCTFRVLYSSQMSRSTFERLLADIPEVTLMLDPA
jgi:hypothetical protein